MCRWSRLVTLVRVIVPQFHEIRLRNSGATPSVPEGRASLADWTSLLELRTYRGVTAARRGGSMSRRWIGVCLVFACGTCAALSRGSAQSAATPEPPYHLLEPCRCRATRNRSPRTSCAPSRWPSTIMAAPRAAHGDLRTSPSTTPRRSSGSPTSRLVEANVHPRGRRLAARSRTSASSTRSPPMWSIPILNEGWVCCRSRRRTRTSADARRGRGRRAIPSRFYPTGRRTYGRVIPADHLQAVAGRRLHASRKAARMPTSSTIRAMPPAGLADLVETGRGRARPRHPWQRCPSSRSRRTGARPPHRQGRGRRLRLLRRLHRPVLRPLGPAP